MAHENSLAQSNAPLFFDQKRFAADIEAGDAINVFRNALNAAQNHFSNRFYEGEEVHTLVNESARFADLICRMPGIAFRGTKTSV